MTKAACLLSDVPAQIVQARAGVEVPLVRLKPSDLFESRKGPWAILDAAQAALPRWGRARGRARTRWAWPLGLAATAGLLYSPSPPGEGDFSSGHGPPHLPDSRLSPWRGCERGTCRSGIPSNPSGPRSSPPGSPPSSTPSPGSPSPWDLSGDRPATLASAGLVAGGTWLLARRLGANRAGAAVTLVVALGGGSMVSTLDNQVFLWGVSALPFFLLGVLAAVRQPRALGGVTLAGLAVAWAVLAGDFEAAYLFGLLGLGAAAIFRKVGPFRALARVATAGLLGLGLAGIQLLPSLAVFRRDRPGGRPPLGHGRPLVPASPAALGALPRRPHSLRPPRCRPTRLPARDEWRPGPLAAHRLRWRPAPPGPGSPPRGRPPAPGSAGEWPSSPRRASGWPWAVRGPLPARLVGPSPVRRVPLSGEAASPMPRSCWRCSPGSPPPRHGAGRNRRPGWPWDWGRCCALTAAVLALAGRPGDPALATWLARAREGAGVGALITGGLGVSWLGRHRWPQRPAIRLLVLLPAALALGQLLPVDARLLALMSGPTSVLAGPSVAAATLRRSGGPGPGTRPGDHLRRDGYRSRPPVPGREPRPGLRRGRPLGPGGAHPRPVRPLWDRGHDPLSASGHPRDRRWINRDPLAQS